MVSKTTVSRLKSVSNYNQRARAQLQMDLEESTEGTAHGLTTQKVKSTTKEENSVPSTTQRNTKRASLGAWTTSRVLDSFIWKGEDYIRVIPAKPLFRSTMVHDVVNRGDVFALHLNTGRLTIVPGTALVDHVEALVLLP